MTVAIIISIAVFVSILFAGYYGFNLLFGFLVLLWSVSLFSIVLAARRPVRIKNADQGMFWIHGFCPAYLHELADSIAEEAALKKASEMSD